MWRVTKPLAGKFWGAVRRPVDLACRISPPVLLASLAFGLLTVSWGALGPQRPPLSAECRELVAAVLPQVVADLAEQRGGLRTAVVTPVARDPSDQVTVALRGAIEESNVLLLEDRRISEKVRNILGLRQVVPSWEELIDDLKAGAAELAVRAEIQRLDAFGQSGEVELAIQLYRVADGMCVFDRVYEASRGTSWEGLLHGEPSAAILVEGSRSARWLTWLVAALLLPILTVSFLVAMVSRRSNRANAFVLVVYTTLGVTLFYGLVGASYPSHSWRWGTTASVALVLFLYNLRILAWLSPNSYLEEGAA